MNNIKFRAWDKRNNKWFHQDLFFLTNSGFYEDYRALDDGHSLFDYEYELMQYTGVKDKNGKEIYEGDIYTQGDENIKYLVVWHDSGFMGKQIGSSSYAGLSHWRDRIEIIGNIHETNA